MMNRLTRSTIAAVVKLMGAPVALAQPGGSGLPLFADPAPLELRITGPLDSLLDDARTEFEDDDDRPERDAQIEVLDDARDPVSLDAKLRIRGHSRLDLCDIPPLSINLDRDDLEGTVFQGQNRLKLVMPCGRSSSAFDYLALEFKAYKLFNELTERSYRVRWATIDFIFNDTRRPRSATGPAFLIEEESEVAERNGLGVIDREQFAVADFDPLHTTMFGLFQFMIANTDWAVLRGPVGESCCHNGKVIGAETGPFYVLPYDFDNSGLISTHYAVPNEILPIRSVTQRYYRGFCELNGRIPDAVAHINSRRQQMEALFDDELLSERSRRRALEFLQTSLDRLNDPDRLESEIIENCRG